VATDHERQQFKNLMAARMEEPHIRELARNPIQLAILLASIYTRGHSLPEERTALYSSCMDLFLDRESEKSDIVRQHRDLLLNIHGYVAWLLHCEGEDGQGRGSIELDRLRKVVSAYLARHGHPTELASYLLTGVIDQVVALVSRVQNAFEFEVQAIREFFVPRHLYKTAFYIPVGSSTSGGTKPERFAEVIRNPYWLNVGRFFAGMCDQGELAFIERSLQELCRDVLYWCPIFPYTVVLTMLNDWVFSSQPKISDSVVELVTHGHGLRGICANVFAHGAAAGTAKLSDSCGRVPFVRRCVSELLNAARGRRDRAMSMHWRT
jgi:hypothetical protein